MFEPSGLENTGVKKIPRMCICKKCRKHKEYHAKNLCNICYSNWRNERVKGKKDYQLM